MDLPVLSLGGIVSPCFPPGLPHVSYRSYLLRAEELTHNTQVPDDLQRALAQTSTFEQPNTNETRQIC